MRTQIRVILGETDTNNTYFIDADADTQINLAQLHVSGEVPCLLTYKDVTAIADQQKYGLPKTDFLQLKDIHFVEGSTPPTRVKILEKVPFDEFNARTASAPTKTGEPAFYKAEFGAVTRLSGPVPQGDFWPYPVYDNTDYLFRLYFYQMPTDLDGDTDVSELPAILHEAVVYRAAMHLAMMKMNQKRVNQCAALYREAIRVGEEVIRKRDRTGFTHQIKDAMGYTQSNLGQISRIRRGPLV
jgi:hypothetical protein